MSKYWAYVKRNPVMFGVAFITFGLLLWLLMSRGGGSASASNIINSGPSEAFQAQAMAINAQQQQAQLAANVQMQGQALELEALTRNIEGQENLAILGMQMQLAELETSRAITSEQTIASLSALQAQLQYGLATTEANNQASVDMATAAYDAQIAQMAIGAGLQRDLLATQADMFNTQVSASLASQSLAMVQTLRRRDRDETLQILSAQFSGNPVSYVNPRGPAIISGSANTNNIGYTPNVAVM